MENYVSQQLMLFARSVLLGMGLALLYDVLRPLRRRCLSFLWLLDSGYCLTAALTAGLFLLRQGDGELRLYILLGAGGGAVLFFLLLSESLRSVWVFWTDTAVATGRLLIYPWQKFRLLVKKTAVCCKNLFYFAEKCYTIRKNGGMGNSRAKSGGKRHGEDPKKEVGKSRLFHKNSHRHAVGRSHVAAGSAADTGGKR